MIDKEDKILEIADEVEEFENNKTNESEIRLGDLD